MPMNATATDFLVSKADLHKTQFVDRALPALADGQVRLAVESFSFTANNVTYAVFGDRMKYWNFYPAPDAWGRIPVWGFAHVQESRATGITVGERVYGYLPMSTVFDISAGKVSPHGFIDASAHRADLAAVYNQYLRIGSDPNYDPKREGEQALLRPLFITSFLIADQLSDNQFYGASRVIIASASSKTALGAGFELRRAHGDRVKVIGLTSASNAAFCNISGCYDQIVSYADVASLGSASPAVYVDMSGDAKLRQAAHTALGGSLKLSLAVGATHWDASPPTEHAPGPKPEMFFAPSQIKKRYADWGVEGFDKHYSKSWLAFLASVDPWLKMRWSSGRDGIASVYDAVLSGKAKPDEGHLLRW